jgi:outer membrane protein OmpA-like peptidoglycan-associated protein
MSKAQGSVLPTFIGFCALLISGFAAAQDIRSVLFKNTDLLLQQAREARAELLSPENYADAQESYTDAELEVAKGRADRAREDLADCDEALRKALEASKLAELTFAAALQARELTVTANAAKYEPELWQEAESRFNDAAKVLERGNIKKAQSLAAEATSEYDAAELAAIKTAILRNARQLISQADDDKVEKYAPRTLGNAKELVAKVDADLDASRYTTAGAQGMAAEAEYQVLHARYIAGQGMALDDETLTGEELILQWEKPLRDVAGVLGASTDMTEGYARPGAESLARAQALTRENVEMAARIGELEIELGGSELIVEEAERLQRQLQDVERLFGPSEARILRESNNLIIRLVGLSFPVGQAVIETQYFGLMRKVQDAIRMFPETQILIEGHTDSTGTDVANIKLSQERASAVREYLVANQVLSGSRVTAIGYGKTRPIASNETTQGRAENRRIDVVIEDVRARFGN